MFSLMVDPLLDPSASGAADEYIRQRKTKPAGIRREGVV